DAIHDPPELLEVDPLRHAEIQCAPFDVLGMLRSADTCVVLGCAVARQDRDRTIATGRADCLELLRKRHQARLDPLARVRRAVMTRDLVESKVRRYVLALLHRKWR